MKLPVRLRAEMVDHALREAPNECVGLVAARGDRAVRVFAAQNADASPERFSIGSEEQYELLMAIEEAGHEIGAIYHSHLHTDAVPSQTDVRYARGWPGVVWIIVGLTCQPPELRAWRIYNKQLIEEPLGP